MTIVCALRDYKTDKIYLGSDSRLSQDNFIISKPVKKIVKFKSFQVGWSGIGIIRHVLDELEGSKKPFMKMTSVKHVRQLGKHVFSQVTMDTELPKEHRIGSLIVCTSDNIYEIDDLGDVIVHDKWCAIGSGRDFALGSFYSTETTRHSGRDRLQLALQAACNFSSDCSAPLFLEEIK